MNEETVTIDFTNFGSSYLPKFKYCNNKVKDFSSTDHEKGVVDHDFVERKLDRRNFEWSITEIIRRDDKDELLARTTELFVEEEASNQEEDDDDDDTDAQKENRNPNLKHHRSIISSLLQISCKLNSVQCAKALIEGEAGSVPYVDKLDQNGLTALHTAAEMHSTECIKLLLSKQARTDLRSKDGNSQIALEMALSSKKIQELWSPDDSIEDLLINLSETDLSSIKILMENTKGILDVAYKCAMEVRVISLTALLMLASEKVTSPIIVPRLDGIVGSKETTNIYECVIKEALSLGGGSNGAGVSSRGARRILGYSTNSEDAGEKRKLLLCEIKLLQLFGATLPGKSCTERRPISTLIRAGQAGDVAILKLILKTKVDVNETDGEGNTALHWCLRTSSNTNNNSNQENNAWRVACLLLKHGARVCKKNRLGLTPVHLAAANGYLQVLQMLLLKDPISVHAVSEMKETPLFYAVKNNFMDCVQLLLRYGADIQKLNLRKQRAVDLAKSQDMRFMLSPTSIGFSTARFQRPCSTPIQGSTSSCNLLTSYEYDSDSDGEMICEALFNPSKEKTTNSDNNFDRLLPLTGAKTEICRYFESPSGCVRGTKCHYAHGDAELLGTKHDLKHSAADIPHYPAASSENLKRKIFVGGLPTSIDSGTLKKIFAEKFGSVDEAFVIGTQSSKDQTHSRGFGFVIFKEEESVAAAVQAHYVTISGKEVEIKGAVSKPILLAEKPIQEQLQLYQKISNEKTSWVEKLTSGGTPYEGLKVKHQDVSSSSSSSSECSLPSWVTTFRKWFPGFLMKVSRRFKQGEYYPLSSVKGDFRATCGLELDHASLGYMKLSDFMRSLPGLCYMKVVPVSGHGQASHMVLVPNHNPRHSIQQPQLVPITEQPPCFDDHDSYNDDQEDIVDYHFVEGPLTNTSGYENFRCSAGNSGEGTSNSTSRFMSTFMNDQKLFLQWDPLFHGQPWFKEDKEGNDGGGDKGPEQVLLYQTLRARDKPFSLFERQYDFHQIYRQCMASGVCFRCKKYRVHWVNKPCGHFLWCSQCKEWANVQTPMMTCYVCNNKITSCEYGAWAKPAPTSALVYQQQRTQKQQVPHDGTNEIDYPPWNPRGAKPPKRSG